MCGEVRSFLRRAHGGATKQFVFRVYNFRPAEKIRATQCGFLGLMR